MAVAEGIDIDSPTTEWIARRGAMLRQNVDVDSEVLVQVREYVAQL